MIILHYCLKCKNFTLSFLKKRNINRNILKLIFLLIAIYISTCFSSPPDKKIDHFFFHDSLFCAHAGLFDPSSRINQNWTGENLVGRRFGARVNEGERKFFSRGRGETLKTPCFFMFFKRYLQQ